MAFRLTVVPPQGGSEFIYDFDQERVIIGRSRGADLQLPHATVSARHATLARVGKGVVVEDQDSSNGTTVNGERLVVGRTKRLRDQDRIGVGGFELVYSGSVAALPSSAEQTAALARRMLREALAPELMAAQPPRLVLVESAIPADLRVAPFELPAPPAALLIGRSPEAALTLTDDGVSREHCQISVREGGVFVTDHDSKNGTLLNGRPLAGRPLRHRDELRIGQALLVFEDPAEELRRRVETEEDRATPPLPAPQKLPAASASDPVPQSRVEEPPRLGHAAPTPRRGGVEGLIYVLAAVVVAASAAALAWLFTN